MELSYRCGKCGQDGSFLILTANGERPTATISCQARGCGRSVTADSLDAAWKKVSEPDQPPAPTIMDARSIPCQEPDEDGRGPPGFHFWGGPQSRPGYRKCPHCGLEVRDWA